jgi:hypothetical protein
MCVGLPAKTITVQFSRTLFQERETCKEHTQVAEGRIQTRLLFLHEAHWAASIERPLRRATTNEHCRPAPTRYSCSVGRSDW